MGQRPTRSHAVTKPRNVPKSIGVGADEYVLARAWISPYVARRRLTSALAESDDSLVARFDQSIDRCARARGTTALLRVFIVPSERVFLPWVWIPIEYRAVVGLAVRPSRPARRGI